MLAVVPAVESIGVAAPFGIPARQWIFPAQTLVCALLVAVWWRDYELRRPARILFTLGIAILVFALWIAPQAVFGAAARRDGFDPSFFENQPALFSTLLAVRLARLVIVVPLIEEIFWRGFLLRYLISENFHAVPFGTYSRGSFAVVTVGFMLEHAWSDWPAALATGALYNVVAYRTKSLSSCILAHALTNFGLGIYIVATRQWGFW